LHLRSRDSLSKRTPQSAPLSRTDAGYTTLKSVVSKEQGNHMPSYFLAETLKYLYLLFAPEETLDLQKVVFNTEAHPLR
jgi:Glycosyl hydrolase family 47